MEQWGSKRSVRAGEFLTVQAAEIASAKVPGVFEIAERLLR